MKKTICFVIALFMLLCVGCAQQPSVTSGDAPTGEPVTVDPELLPDIFEDASAFVSAGNIDIAAPLNASEVTQIILFDEISQVQFTVGEVFFNYRAAFASTNRSGYDLTGIVPELEYTEDEVTYENENVHFTFEAHLLENGAILLWSDGEINYSLSSYGGTFDDLSAVADLILN